MYYSFDEIKNAIQTATDIINNRTKVNGFVFGYSDCFCFLVEYDKALRKKDSVAEQIFTTMKYNSTKEYLLQLKKNKLTLRSLAIASGYEIRNDLRPQFGDIGYMEGSAVIAGNGRWVTADEDSSGVKEGYKYQFFDRHLKLLARPLRS